ncbi:MAG: hypothetical protein JRE57_05945 [Deltaproteobacteria bacterium]|nr:hypothetical protein [Deltaproteobacteria bacterium]
MTLDALGNIGELVGALGVVISLGYLAGQIRQNTKAVKASSHHSLNDAFSAYLKLLIDNNRAAQILAIGVRNIRDLDDEQRDTFYAVLSLLFNHFENTHMHYREGLLDADQWRRWAFAIGWYAGFPGIEVWWKNRAGIFPAAFRAMVDAQRILQGPTNPDQWAPADPLAELEAVAVESA